MKKRKKVFAPILTNFQYIAEGRIRIKTFPEIEDYIYYIFCYNKKIYYKARNLIDVIAYRNAWLKIRELDSAKDNTEELKRRIKEIEIEKEQQQLDILKEKLAKLGELT